MNCGKNYSYTVKEYKNPIFFTLSIVLKLS